MKKIFFTLLMLMNFIVFAGDEIMHISKVYSDGTPKEVIIYRQVSDDLKTNNPFEIVEKITYNTKGEYIEPRITNNDLRNAKNWIAGNWSYSTEFGEMRMIVFYKDGTFIEGKEIEEQGDGRTGTYSIIERDNKVVVEINEFYYSIIFNNRNESILTDLDQNRVYTLNRK